jgi:hypothetical protein
MRGYYTSIDCLTAQIHGYPAGHGGDQREVSIY